MQDVHCIRFTYHYTSHYQSAIAMCIVHTCSLYPVGGQGGNPPKILQLPSQASPRPMCTPVVVIVGL